MALQEAIRYEHVREARNSFVKRFRRILRVALDETDDGFLATGAIEAIDVATNADLEYAVPIRVGESRWSSMALRTLQELAAIALGETENPDAMLHFVHAHLKDKVATRVTTDGEGIVQHSFGDKKVVDRRHILSVVNGPRPPPLPKVRSP